MDPLKYNPERAANYKRTEAPSVIEQRHVGAMMDHVYSHVNPSAPPLPSDPYNSGVPSMEPPSYSSVMAEDARALGCHPGSFTGINCPPPNPGTTSQPTITPGPVNQAPNPAAAGTSPTDDDLTLGECLAAPFVCILCLPCCVFYMFRAFSAESED